MPGVGWGGGWPQKCCRGAELATPRWFLSVDISTSEISLNYSRKLPDVSGWSKASKTWQDLGTLDV